LEKTGIGLLWVKAKWSKIGNVLSCFATVLCVLGVTAVVCGFEVA